MKAEIPPPRPTPPRPTRWAFYLNRLGDALLRAGRARGGLVRVGAELGLACAERLRDLAEAHGSPRCEATFPCLGEAAFECVEKPTDPPSGQRLCRLHAHWLAHTLNGGGAGTWHVRPHVCDRECRH